MEHKLPTDHKGLLQAILRELTLQRDAEATFAEAEPEPDQEPAAPAIGR